MNTTRNNKEIPFRITKERLEERITSGFPASYLTSLSIIQGVAFGVLIFLGADAFRQKTEFSTLAIILISFGNLIIVWSEYSWFTRIYAWPPTYVDAAIPFVVGASGVIPMFFFRSTSGWAVATAILPIAGIVAYLNTLKHTTPDMFKHDRPDIAKKCYRLLRRRLIFVMALLLIVAAFLLLLGLLPHSMGDVALGTLYIVIFLITYMCFIWSFSEQSDEVLDLYGIPVGNLDRFWHRRWHQVKPLSLGSCGST